MELLVLVSLAAITHAVPQFFNHFAIPTVLPDGHLADTPEVAAAKAFHFAQHAKALSGVSTPVFQSDFTHFNNGPVTAPNILPDGHLADTPEVAAAKAFHFAQHAKALSGVSTPVFQSDFTHFNNGPVTAPTILPDGHLADTPEVTAAKIAHFAEHARTLAGHTSFPKALFTPGVFHFYDPNNRIFYNGPLASPTVLPDGHLADTPEVVSAKAAHFAEYAKALSLSRF